MSSGSTSRTGSPMAGFLCRTPWYHASPASLRPSRPAHTDSVWAELGLAWQYRSRRKIRQPRCASIPSSPPAASISSAEKRAGRKFITSTIRAGARPMFL